MPANGFYLEFTLRLLSLQQRLECKQSTINEIRNFIGGSTASKAIRVGWVSEVMRLDWESVGGYAKDLGLLALCKNVSNPNNKQQQRRVTWYTYVWDWLISLSLGKTYVPTRGHVYFASHTDSSVYLFPRLWPFVKICEDVIGEKNRHMVQIRKHPLIIKELFKI